MKVIAILTAMLLASATTAGIAGIAPSTSTSAAAQSGAKIAPPKNNQESQTPEEHNAQPNEAK